MAYPKKLNPDWIRKGINDQAIEWSQEFAKYLAPENRGDRNALTTSQLRKFFGQLRRIEADYEKLNGEIPMLKPKLAYAVGKAGNYSRIRDFYDQMNIGLSAIDNSKENFNRFISLTESIVAFHKFHGGE